MVQDERCGAGKRGQVGKYAGMEQPFRVLEREMSEGRLFDPPSLRDGMPVTP